MTAAQQVALVTGASSGIGKATAIALATAGFQVIGTGRNTARSTAPAGVTYLDLDVTNDESVATVVKQVIDQFGHIDVLINNAGHGDPMFTGEMRADDWDRMLTTNLRSAFLMSQAVWKPFTEQGGGVIVNASSITGQWAMFGLAAYGASKAGLVTMTKVMAIEGGRVGIRVNCISPGYILTPGFQEYIDLQDDPAAFHDAMASQSALGRFGSPRDVAEGYLYLASDAAGWVTGTNLVIDGGITAGQLPNADPRT
jgi:NAD(P)-dependent dehydrogenase (short-subunit alcohol dehydrogenase family)